MFAWNLPEGMQARRLAIEQRRLGRTEDLQTPELHITYPKLPKSSKESSRNARAYNLVQRVHCADAWL